MSQRDILAVAARRFADDPTDPNLVDLIAAVMELPFDEMPEAPLGRLLGIAGGDGPARRVVGTTDSLGNRSTIQFAKAE